MRLLVTRPEPDAERTAAALVQRGHAVLLMPLMRIEPVEDAALGPGPWAALLVTSANACRAVADHPRLPELIPIPLLAVGRRSAAAARALGFASVTSADGDAAALAKMVAIQVKDRTRPLLYLAGEDRAADLEGLLAAEGFVVRTVVVYRAVAETQFSEAAATALVDDRLDGVLHFSARSATACLAAAAAAGLTSRLLNIRHYCLSMQVAAPLAAAGATDLRVAPEPTESDLLAVIGRA